MKRNAIPFLNRKSPCLETSSSLLLLLLGLETRHDFYFTSLSTNEQCIKNVESWVEKNVHWCYRMGLNLVRLSYLQVQYCKGFSFFIQTQASCNTKVIKEKWGQYFAIDHFYTPLCSNRNGHIVIKNFLEQKFAKSSVINLVPNAWFNGKNAIKKVRVELVFQYCLYYALWLCFYYFLQLFDVSKNRPNWPKLYL